MKMKLNQKFLILVCAFGLLSGCQNKQLYRDNRVMMGTIIEVTSPEKKAPAIVFNEIKRIEDLLSRYKADSEVSRLNRSGKLKVSPDTFYIIKKSKEFWQASNGAFDITVAPLVDLWGFTDKKYHLPSQDEINPIMNLVGSDKIILQENDNVIEFGVAGMKIDLGGIAKGYALDCAADKLRKAGIKSCLINAGGQVYCLGDKFGNPWRIAMVDPSGKGFAGVLGLKNKSASTSGDYEQFFIKDNKRYAHILDPKTGSPADSGVAAVTVVAKDGLTADALSTAIFVLGKEKGKALAKRFPGTEVKIIERKDVQNNG
jgi:thiamine biosynthesis lipoprotein